MPISMPSRPFLRFWKPLGIPLTALALVAWAGLQGCKTVDIDGPAADSTLAKDSATLSISNHIEQDPESLTFVLFPANAVDFVNATPAKRLGAVDTGATKTFRVPAGSWKLAYENGAKVLFPMVEDNTGAGEWLRAVFQKDASYALILSTDGNRTVWNGNFKTDPETR